MYIKYSIKPNRCNIDYNFSIFGYLLSYMDMYCMMPGVLLVDTALIKQFWLPLQAPVTRTTTRPTRGTGPTSSSTRARTTTPRSTRSCSRGPPAPSSGTSGTTRVRCCVFILILYRCAQEGACDQSSLPQAKLSRCQFFHYWVARSADHGLQHTLQASMSGASRRRTATAGCPWRTSTATPQHARCADVPASASDPLPASSIDNLSVWV